MIMRRRGIFFAALAVLAVPMAAQTVRVLEFSQPKRDHLDEFRAAINDYTAVMKRVGDPHAFTVWNSLSGPAESFRMVDFPNWAERDGPNASQRHPAQAAEIARINQRFNNANQSLRTVILRLVSDSSLPLDNDFPPMIVARWVRLAPGHGSEYVAATKSDILPAVKKAGIKSYSFWQVVFGAQQSQYLALIGIDNWASFDRPDPTVAAMGNEAYQRFRAKTRPIMVEAREDVYRFSPETSYLPAAR